MARTSRETRPVKEQSRSAGWKGWIAPRIFGRQLPWYWTPIALVVLVVLVHLQTRLAIKETAYYLMQSFQFLGQPSIRNVEYGFDGSIRLQQLAFQTGDDSAGVEIGTIEIATPGWWWLMRQQLPGGGSRRSSRLPGEWAYPPTPTLALHLRDVEWGDYYLGYVVPGLEWVGYTGALFEAEGCPEDGLWTRADLSDRLKLDPGRGDISVAFEVTGEKALKRTVHLGHAGLSELTMVSTYELPGPANRFIEIDSDSWRTTSTRWRLEDHGFVARRNEFCAEQAGVDLATLHERHLRSVERVLAVHGARASAELLDTYGAWARDGGVLEFETGLPAGRAWEDYTQLGLEGILAGVGASVTVGERRAAYLLSAIPEQPWPDFEWGSTWNLIQTEQGKVPAAPRESPAAQPAQLASVPSASTAPVAAPVPAPAAPAAPATPARPAASARAAGNESLEQLVGSRVELLLEGNRRLRGMLESLDARQLRLRVQAGNGYAQMTLQRERVVRALRL